MIFWPPVGASPLMVIIPDLIAVPGDSTMDINTRGKLRFALKGINKAE